MTETSNNRDGFRTKMRNMEVGDVLKFPIARTPSVRTSASDLGLCLSRKYRTVSNRQDQTVTVTRIK